MGEKTVKFIDKSGLCAVLLASAALTSVPAFAAMAPAGAPAAAPAPPSAERPAADVERDATRKPTQIIAFAGVKPGMTVGELGPGGFYYTRLLSKAVGPKGKVYAILNAFAAGRPGALDQAKALAAVLGNVEVLVADYPTLVLPTKADLIWTTENYHDYHNGATANVPGLNKAVFENLKPGGIFYVEDHSAAPSAGLEAAQKFHRMDEAVAKTELTAAGFKLDGETNLLRNPSDNRASSNSEAGHFVTDRFGLRMKKPG